MNRIARRAAVAAVAAGTVGMVLAAAFIHHGVAGHGAASQAAPIARPRTSTPVAARHDSVSTAAGNRGGRASGSAVLGWQTNSTIPAGQFQLCAQGNFSAFALPEPPFGSTDRLRTGGLLSPGSCEMWPLDTGGQEVTVAIIGVDPATQQQFTVGHVSYNSASPVGLGVGAEGTPQLPFWWQW